MSKKRDTVEAEDPVLRVRKIGNSTGVIFPKDLLARFALKEGDSLYVVEGAERGMKLTPYDPKHATALEIARRSFRAYADTYKALAR